MVDWPVVDWPVVDWPVVDWPVVARLVAGRRWLQLPLVDFRFLIGRRLNGQPRLNCPSLNRCQSNDWMYGGLFQGEVVWAGSQTGIDDRFRGPRKNIRRSSVQL